MKLLRFGFSELPRAFDKFEPAHRGAMIIPYRQVPSDKASRACHPEIGCRIARAGHPHHNVVVLDFELRGKSANSAFIDLGDQFLALQKGRTQPADEGRHFGLVVDDRDAVRKALADAGIQPLPGPFLDFIDPWGNRIEIVGYDNVQFTKAPNVLRGMGLTHLSKNEQAIKELTAKGMAPN